MRVLHTIVVVSRPQTLTQFHKYRKLYFYKYINKKQDCRFLPIYVKLKCVKMRGMHKICKNMCNIQSKVFIRTLAKLCFFRRVHINMNLHKNPQCGHKLISTEYRAGQNEELYEHIPTF